MGVKTHPEFKDFKMAKELKDYKMLDEVVLRCCTYIVTGLTVEGVFIHIKNDDGDYSINSSMFVPTDRLHILEEVE